VNLKILPVIELYVNTERGFEKKSIDEFGELSTGVLWIDVLNPSEEEIRWLESSVGFENPPREVMGDIEISSKYMEFGDSMGINMSFVIQRKEEILVEPVFFFIKDRFFITLRYKDIPTLLIFHSRVNTQRKTYQFAESLFSEI
jgi:magnesium transporter